MAAEAGGVSSADTPTEEVFMDASDTSYQTAPLCDPDVAECVAHAVAEGSGPFSLIRLGGVCRELRGAARRAAGTMAVQIIVGGRTGRMDATAEVWRLDMSANHARQRMEVGGSRRRL